jgi:GTP-binding protein
MLLYHRILPRLLTLTLTLPARPTSQLLLRPSRFPPRRPFLPRSAALSQLAPPPETADYSDAEEPEDHPDAEEPLRDEQVKLPLDRLFLPPGASVTPGDEEGVTARVLKGSNIVLGTYARGDAQVVNADFVKSSVRPDDCPKDGRPEFALVGRSNVGKSSLLNSLVRRKRLALTSKKPGKAALHCLRCLIICWECNAIGV